MRPAVVCLLLPAVLLVLLPAPAASQDPTPLGISMPPSINFSGTPSPVGSGARAEGMGGAFIAVADDATAASWNPAGLVQLERPEVSAVGAFHFDADLPLRSVPSLTLEREQTTGASLNYLSVVWPFSVLRRNVVASLNIQRMFSFAHDVDAGFGVLSDVLTGVQQVHARERGTLYTLTPALAVQILPALSIGVSVNFWKDGVLGSGWRQDVEVTGQGFGTPGAVQVPYRFSGRISERYRLFGVNVTAGILWKVSERFAVGGIVKTPFRADLDFSHDSVLQLSIREDIPASGVLMKRVTRDGFLDMPLSYGVGVSARLSDRSTLNLDFSRTEWSGFKRSPFTEDLPDFIRVNQDPPAGKGKAVLEGRAAATNHVRLGAEYVFRTESPVLPLRLGVFYDPEPNERRPDDFWGLSSGVGLAWKRVALDAAYTFRTGTTRNPLSEVESFQHRFLLSAIWYL